ncbi:class I SAM-dependent methyltransferase [Iamia majanohamensis]|uniref:Class I SAM-dependent methyltransferase n=1 Tax=Iamia majanohamensis TaxID=467976 RepID=A0AAE9Y9Q6_9ACTN|nr:class I SAM-dependent methyltransferase [Iamia majanohamensis]WCO67228.1 class I SAM-dependent methyltransferase [Iamia majanohamensis]
MTTGWDGGAYDAAAGPQRDAGARLVDRLEVAEGAVVVDAGCGSGRVTELLLDRHPTASVVGIDASASMLAAAADRLARHAGRVRLVEADLAEPWPLSEPVDLVVSTNAFHWVRDHDRLFAAAFAALRPGGRLGVVAGGTGSLASVRAAARRAGVGVEGRNHYADAETTTRRLEAAGFVDVVCTLEEEPVRFPSRAALAEYLADAALAPYDRGAERAAQVAAALEEPVADFVRLTLAARRPILA